MTDHDIDKLYKAHAKEQPPVVIDNVITALAQQSVQPVEKIKTSPHRRYLPYSVAASMALVGILVVNFPQNYLSPTNEPLIDPIENEPVNEQKILQMMPDNLHSTPEMAISAPVKMKAIKAVSTHRRSQSQKKYVSSPQLLIQRIEAQIAINNSEKVNQLIQQFVQQHGLVKLPDKYHHLIEKTD